MEDGEIKVSTKIDNSELDKGLKDTKKKLNETSKELDKGSKSAKSFSDGLQSIVKGGAVAGAIGTVVSTLKKFNSALVDCNETYKVQQKAELALENAAKNNPYLNKESVARLEEYAGALQKISNFGDEGTIRIMSELAATGRTEAEIMQIMGAAADYAAATNTSLDSAAQTLNMTFSGMAGTLGRQIGDIKNLTAEELKAGKAIDIVAKKYKGFAENMADASLQSKNAFGDFKESIGNLANTTFNMFDNRAVQFWQGMTAKLNEFTNLLDTLNTDSKFGGTYKANNEILKETMKSAASVSPNKKSAYLEDVAIAQNDAGLNQAIHHLELQNKLTADEKLFLDILKEEQGYRERKAARTKEEAEYREKIKDFTLEQLQAESKRLENSGSVDEINHLTVVNDLIKERKRLEDEKKNQRDADALKYIQDNESALKKQIETLKIKASITGEEIDAQEELNVYLQAYIDLITQSNGLVTENNSAAKKQLEIIKQKAEAIKNETDAERKKQKAQDLYNELKGDGETNFIDAFKQRNEQIKQLQEDINAGLLEGVIDTNQAMKEADELYAQNKKDLWANLLNEIQTYSDQINQVIHQASELMMEKVKAEKEVELASIEEQYDKGEIAEEDYYQKRKEIRKKAAQEEYKIKMFEWTSSYLTAIANIAQGVTKAIAQGGTMGIITGALVGAAGAVQLASITASKPIPPSFATGGVIGGMYGATMGSDNTYIHARSGEMIINASQQRSLWDMLNGQETRGFQGMNLTVNNTMSDRADTKIQQRNNELFIDILDKHINQEFANGGYDTGFGIMQSKQTGVSIL